MIIKEPMSKSKLCLISVIGIAVSAIFVFIMHRADQIEPTSNWDVAAKGMIWLYGTIGVSFVIAYVVFEWSVAWINGVFDKEDEEEPETDDELDD